MKLYIFCVKDRATDAFGTPMFMAATGQAVRSFSDEVNRAADDNQLNRHPDDFDLYEVGVFDTDDGSFDVFVPRLLTRGKDVSLNFIEKN
ncbi:MAG: nonstructural protein [Microvirus sp.]|nr:MAG: nonstructural protein [Microvirus sp.]